MKLVQSKTDSTNYAYLTVATTRDAENLLEAVNNTPPLYLAAKIKNKDKEKNKIQDDRPPYFDFNTLRSKTVRILLLSICLSSFGLNAPLIYVVNTLWSNKFQVNYLLK